MVLTEINSRQIPTFDAQAGIDQVNQWLKGRTDQNLRTIITIAAYSSSGKGFLQSATQKVFPADLMQSIDGDDYYLGEPFMSEQQASRPDLNWDHPDAVNRLAMIDNALSIKSGHPFTKPCYVKKSSRIEQWETLEARMITFFGGNYTLYDAAMRNLADLKIFVTTSRHTRLIRRLLRDSNALDWTPAEILKYFITVVEPMADNHIKPTIQYADLIIRNDLIAEIEYARTELYQQQFKFNTTLSSDYLRRRGAAYLLSGRQIDNYYTPIDQDIMANDEIVRIRQEGQQFIFSSKGPRRGQDNCERPKFEFPIDRETAEIFPDFYGPKAFTITKNRSLFEFDGCIIAVDTNVERKNPNGTINQLGDFIEIRQTHNKTADPSKLFTLASKIGLSMSNMIKKAYIDI